MTRFDGGRDKSGHDGSSGIAFDARDVLRGDLDDATVEQVVKAGE
ncbi:MAG: hypothetical protein ACOCZD_00130 [Haloferacaceae archaeon]